MAGTHPLAALGVARALLGPRREPELDVPPARPAVRVRNGVFLAEHYLHDVTASSVDALTRRLTAAAEELRRRGTEVRVLGSAGLPGDEALLHVLSAPSEETAAEAVAQAGLVADRIVPVVWSAG
jgi:hypothetical protein